MTAEPVPPRALSRKALKSVTYPSQSTRTYDILRHPSGRLTNLATESFGWSLSRLQMLGLHHSFAEAGHEVALLLRQIVVEAVDGLDDHAPLCESGDHADRVQPCLELERHADAELRVILDLLAVLRPRGRTAYTPAVLGFRVAVVGH